MSHSMAWWEDILMDSVDGDEVVYWYVGVAAKWE